MKERLGEWLEDVLMVAAFITLSFLVVIELLLRQFWRATKFLLWGSR